MQAEALHVGGVVRSFVSAAVFCYQIDACTGQSAALQATLTVWFLQLQENMGKHFIWQIKTTLFNATYVNQM